MQESPFESLQRGANDLVSSARTKLRLMGLTDAQIRRLGEGKTSPMNLILPKGKVWIYAEIFEYEISGVKEGQSVEVTSPSIPGKTFNGQLTSVSPILNSQTRTVRVRALVPDPDGSLRPDTFVNVKIKVTLGDKLTIPADSVLHSGEEDFVFVVQGEGRFEPRRVTVGTKAQDTYEILSGLSPNETVVTAANFLIDSESRLRGVLQNMKGAPSGGKP
jgi:Cu(I)/Ag(I) efflux system membrane fusion protein